VSNAAEEVKPLVNPVSGNDAGHDGRAIRLMVILGMRLPEYFFADGANSNLATSTRQELPALTKFEAFQQIMIEQVWMPIFRRVLQNAIDAGMLGETLEIRPHPLAPSPLHGEGGKSDAQMIGAVPAQNGHHAEPVGAWQPTELPTRLAMPGQNGHHANGHEDEPRAQRAVPLQTPDDAQAVGAWRAMPNQPPQMISALDAFEVSYEPVTAQDLNALANMLDLAVKNEWASAQTAAEKLGFDPSIERERIMNEIASEDVENPSPAKRLSPLRGEGLKSP
jgi:hypothetical protein